MKLKAKHCKQIHCSSKAEAKSSKHWHCTHIHHCSSKATEARHKPTAEAKHKAAKARHCSLRDWNFN